MYLHSPLTDAFIVSVMCDMAIGQEQCRELETFGNQETSLKIYFQLHMNPYFIQDKYLLLLMPLTYFTIFTL
jgi:hypothetical protein